MANQVKSAGGTPIILTSLTRRTFTNSKLDKWYFLLLLACSYYSKYHLLPRTASCNARTPFDCFIQVSVDFNSRVSRKPEDSGWDSPFSTAMGTCRAAKSPCATALVVEVATIARQAALAGTATAIHRGDVGCDARARGSALAVAGNVVSRASYSQIACQRGSCPNLPSLTTVVRRTAAVASARATITKRRADACLAVGAALPIGRNVAAPAAAGAEATLAPRAAVGSGAPAVARGRAARAKRRAGTRLAVGGAALAVRRDAPTPAAARAKTRLAPGAAVVGRPATVPIRRAAVAKPGPAALLAVDAAAPAVARHVGGRGARAEAGLAPGAAVGRRVAAVAVGRAAVAEGRARADLAAVGGAARPAGRDVAGRTRAEERLASGAAGACRVAALA